jgi:uncharacterized membrane protein
VAPNSKAEVSVVLGKPECHSPIVNAIRLVEESSTGQIRVHLSKRWVERNTLQRTQHLFDYYKQADNVPNNNLVLIYVNLRKKKFAILGDEGIHQAVGNHYWSEIAQELKENLQSTESEGAIALTVTSIGHAMKKYFPSASD